MVQMRLALPQAGLLPVGQVHAPDYDLKPGIWTTNSSLCLMQCCIQAGPLQGELIHIVMDITSQARLNHNSFMIFKSSFKQPPGFIPANPTCEQYYERYTIEPTFV